MKERNAGIKEHQHPVSSSPSFGSQDIALKSWPTTKVVSNGSKIFNSF